MRDTVVLGQQGRLVVLAEMRRALRLAPADRLAAVTQPVLLTTGASLDDHATGLPTDFYAAAAEATAALLPDARCRTIEIQGTSPTRRSSDRS